MSKFSRRAGHAALAGTTAALCWAAAEDLSSRKAVRLAGLLMLGTITMAGPVSGAKASVKAQLAHLRIDKLVSGATPAGALNLGNGNLTSAFTGSVPPPGVIGAAGATYNQGYEQAQSTRINDIINTLNYIIGELSTHNFSSN